MFPSHLNLTDEVSQFLHRKTNPTLNPMPDIKPLLESLWRHAPVIRIESWASREPEFPGHDSEAAAKREFRVARFNERAILLLRELGTDLDPDVRVVRNVKNTTKSIDEALALEEYDGWSKKTFFLKELRDQTAEIQTFLSEHYTPLLGSALTAPNLARILGLWNGALGYLRVSEGKASLCAIDGKRTGITTGKFIYDTSFLFFLKGFKFDVEEVGYAVRSGIDPSVINHIWAEALESGRSKQIAYLERELASAELRITDLRQQLAHLKTS